jgi:hypothetical protein
VSARKNRWITGEVQGITLKKQEMSLKKDWVEDITGNVLLYFTQSGV